MIDLDVMQSYIRDANPIPNVDDVDPDELAAFVAAAHVRRAVVMQTTPRHRTPATPITSPPPRRRRRVWAFAAAFVLPVVAIGAVALALRNAPGPAADAPAPPITAAEESEEVVSVASLTWSSIDLGTEGPGLHITAGDPGLVGVGVYHRPDPNDLADGGGGPRWVQGYLDLPSVWISTDGYEWSRVPGSDEAFGGEIEIADVAGGDDGFVAVANMPGRAWTSPDGITWSSVPAGTFGQSELRGVIAGGPGFVAFGEDGPSNHATIWTSPDGLTWERVPDDPAIFSENANMYAMAAGAPGLVAAGFDEATGNPVVWTSADAYTWTRVPHDPEAFGEGDPEQWPPARIHDVAAGDPGFIAVGSYMDQAATWTSPDGVAWSRASHEPAVSDAPRTAMTGVAAVGDGLVAIGTRGDAAAVWISHDGLTWTQITDRFDPTGNALMIEVIAGGPGAVILGEALIADYIDRPPLIKTVLWIGSPA